MKKISVTIEKYNLKPQIDVYKNPQHSEIKCLIKKYNELRAILDFKNNALWVWDANQSATHIDIEKNIDDISNDNEYLYIKYEDSFIVYRHNNPNCSLTRLKKHPKLIQSLKNNITIKSIIEAKTLI